MHRAGVEPATRRLKAGCSAFELPVRDRAWAPPGVPHASVHREGFEPSADCLEGSCSFRLSFRCVGRFPRAPFPSGLHGSRLLRSASAPGRSRTYNLPLKRRWLCRLSYECSIFSTYNYFARECTGKGSNLQPPASKAGALPVELPVRGTRGRRVTITASGAAVRRGGFEPPASRLSAGCSTTELTACRSHARAAAGVRLAGLEPATSVV